MKKYIIYENIESVYIINNTPKNLEYAKGFEYELIDEKTLKQYVKAMKESETHYIVDIDKGGK